MFEFQLLTLHPTLVNNHLPVNCKPHLQFIGDLFEYDTNYARIKNYFFDFFHENIQVPSLDISKEFSHIIQFTALEDKILMKTYSITLDTE